MKLAHCGRSLDLERVAVMGILNVTPDSFFNGGRYDDIADAIERGMRLDDEGAAIIDVGGESTRPGAEPVPEDEELARVIPVIEALAARSGAAISIDTRKPSVAQRAVEAGATILNDTLGEEGPPSSPSSSPSSSPPSSMAEVAAATGAALVTMHSRGMPQTMTRLTDYSDVVADTVAWLKSRAEALEGAGLERDAIVLDPGIGFAKTAEQSLMLLKRLDELVALGYPVLSGTSHKSFIGAVLDVPPEGRLNGTAATVAWAVAKGARLVRVHDVAPALQVARMTEAIAQGRPPGP